MPKRLLRLPRVILVLATSGCLLARDLLERKETDAVMTYFELCAKFWKLELGNLQRWSVLAKAGEIPDFGSNLFY